VRFRVCDGARKDLLQATRLRARGHRVDRIVDGLEEEMRDGSRTPGEATVARLATLGEEPWAELGGWREARWVAASVEAAWRSPSSPAARALLRAAVSGAVGSERRQCAAVVRQLLTAKSLTAAGSHPAAIAACDDAAQLAAGNRHLQALALEMRGDTFREIDDADGEVDSLVKRTACSRICRAAWSRRQGGWRSSLQTSGRRRRGGPVSCWPMPAA